MISAHTNSAKSLMRFLLPASVIFFVSAVSAAEKPGSLSEHQVKAAFLYNFIKFVEWPSGTFPDKDSPILIGVIGADPLGKAAEELLRGKSINGRELAVRPAGWPGDVKGFHILLICGSASKSMPLILGTLKELPILTVGDMDNFGTQGGIINFYIEKKKVRFEINIDTAEKARLKISSQLLGLARIIRNEPRNGRV